MKVLTVIAIMMGAGLNAQNAFVDGINETKDVEWKDGKDHFHAFGFKIEFIGTCSAKYTATEMTFENGAEDSYRRETNFNWIDIASIEVDTVKNILRFNSHNPMPCNKIDTDTKSITKDTENDTLNIYYKNTSLCKNAAKWALEHIKTCGGKALLIN